MKKSAIKNIYTTAILLVLALNVSAQKDTYTLKDSRDGNTYRVVKIGEQDWMAENLKYLPGVVGPGTGSGTEPYYYVYGYDGADVCDAKANGNYATYGVLYNWPAAMNETASSSAKPSPVQGVCPSGWHLPGDAEWTALTDHLGRRVAGGKLKEKGTAHWFSPNKGATNKSGFTALPGGYRKEDGSFVSLGEDCDCWSSTEYDTNNAWFRNIHYYDNDVGRNNYNKETGFYVRCVRDK